MLPNRFSLTKTSEEILKKEKNRTGIPPNIAARALFFQSIDKGEKFLNYEKINFGSMHLEKTVWLGETQTLTEIILVDIYGEKQPLELAWALHIASSLKLI